MVIGVNCGHTVSGPGSGAVGIINESQHTRLVGHALMNYLRSAGCGVIDCTIDSANTSEEYLAAAVALANRQDLDWFISIHFNASASHNGNGVEVYTYEGRQYQDALDVCGNIADLGFVNRGVKAGTGLYVIRKSKAKSMLIEVCFCDNQKDVDLYNLAGGPDAIARAIYKAIYDHAVFPEETQKENHNMTREQFIEFVGEVARRDWEERRIMIPSVVVAQALKESGFGTSELAQRANAIFGIKSNEDWNGPVYVKDADEQNPDGTYRVEKDTLWRKYGSWEESIIDHNTYIATRKIGKQKEPNWHNVIGEESYILAVQHLQGAQYAYATSKTYAESLINDYIEKYDLVRFDIFEDDTAPDGTLWIVQLGAYKYKRNAIAFQKRLEKMGVISLIKNYRTE